VEFEFGPRTLDRFRPNVHAHEFAGRTINLRKLHERKSGPAADIEDFQVTANSEMLKKKMSKPGRPEGELIVDSRSPRVAEICSML
jgi:hypothetical protein